MPSRRSAYRSPGCCDRNPRALHRFRVFPLVQRDPRKTDPAARARRIERRRFLERRAGLVVFGGVEQPQPAAPMGRGVRTVEGNRAVERGEGSSAGNQPGCESRAGTTRARGDRRATSHARRRAWLRRTIRLLRRSCPGSATWQPTRIRHDRPLRRADRCGHFGRDAVEREVGRSGARACSAGGNAGEDTDDTTGAKRRRPGRRVATSRPRICGSIEPTDHSTNRTSRRTGRCAAR